MTPPCRNCHGRPETPPDLSSYPQLSLDPLKKSFAGPLVPLPMCSAQAQWPDWLKTPQVSLQQVPWWVRSNFEVARVQKAQVENAPFSPLRLDLGEAEVKTSLKFVPLTRSLKQWWIFDLADLKIDPGASIEGNLKVKDNALVLRSTEKGQPGPLDLFTIQGITLDGPATFNGTPKKISVGDWGELHVLAQTSQAFRFTLDPYMVPRPAPGYDFPTDEQMAMKGVDWISTPVVYRNPQKDVETDFVLTPNIPAALLESDGRLPEAYNLETLIGRLVEFLGKRPKDTEPSKVKLQEILAFLDPSSKIEVNLNQIKDLFIPGVLDLGPSNVKIQLGLTADRMIELRIPEVNLLLDPMDYPAVPEEKRPPLRLKEGVLQAGPAFTTTHGRILEPGIHAIYDPNSKVIDLTANLMLQATVELPGLGEVLLSGHVLLETEMLKTDSGIKLFPKTTTLKINGLDLMGTGDKPAFLADLNFSLTDDPQNIDPVSQALFFHPGTEPAVFSLSGQIGQEGWLDLRGHVPIPKDFDGAYDFGRILQEGPLEAETFYNAGKASYETRLKIASLKPDLLGLDPFSDTAYSLEFDVDQHQKNKTEPLIKEGSLFVQRSQKGRGLEQWLIALGASLVKNGPLELKDLDTVLRIDRAKYADQITEIRIPTFHISANPRGSSSGPLRGPIRIEQVANPSGGLDLMWDGGAKKLEVSNLDLALNAQGLYVLPPPFLRLLGPKIASVGLDGHLKGHFSMVFPEDKTKWKGSGDLFLRGDSRGDIYFLDPSGRQVGPPLIRDTRWHFRRVDWINWKRQYALGNFHLDTIINLNALLPAGSSGSVADDVPVFGARGQRLNPYEINGVMPYDNMPWSKTGFQNRIVDYVLTLCRQDPSCLDAMTQRKVESSDSQKGGDSK